MTDHHRASESPYPAVPLSADGSEFLKFFPLDGQDGWAIYITGGDPDTARGWVLLRFAQRATGADGKPLPPHEVPVGAPIEIQELRMIAESEQRAATLRGIPFDRIEAAVNHPRYRADLLKIVRPWQVWAWPNQLTLDPPANPAPNLKIVDDGEAGPDARRRKPTAFYAAVADRFLWLASTTTRPAQALAEANGVPVTTVHRWVREAKIRGVLILPSKAGVERE